MASAVTSHGHSAGTIQIWAMALDGPSVPKERGIALKCARRPEITLFRGLTVRLLRRFLTLSLQVGRVPAICGREVFRTHTSYRRRASFEDAVNFTIDIEHCLAKLDLTGQQVIAAVVLKGYGHAEAARTLRCTDRAIRARLADALDQLTEMFADRKLLKLDFAELLDDDDKNCCQDR